MHKIIRVQLNVDTNQLIIMKIVQPHKHTDLYVPGLIQMKYNSEFADGTASIASCIFLKSPLPD